MKKKNNLPRKNLYIVLVYLLFIFSFLFLHLYNEDITFSESENRNLQNKPHFTFESFFTGQYTAQLDEYIIDQFPFRTMWVKSKSTMEYLMGKSENNNVFFTHNHSLIHNLPMLEQHSIDTNIRYIQKFSDDTEVSVYTTVIPSQLGIYPNLLDRNTPYQDEINIIHDIYQKFDSSAFINVHETLLNHKNEYIYYHTDHHWTSLGAYYAYAAIMNSLGHSPIAITDYSPTIHSTDFYGTLDSKAYTPFTKADTITTYISNQDIEYTTVDGTNLGLLYDYSLLNVKNQYQMFLGGNHPLVNINGNGDKNLLIIGDSYSNCLVPFFIPHFKSIHLVDLRTNKYSMSEYIINENIDKVVICYSISNFITDKNLVFLR